MTPIAASVLADWGAWTAPLEGRVAWAYLDTKGLVTVGLGCLIDPIGLAIRLPWLHEDGSPASTGEIAGEWDRVKSMRAGLEYHHYRGSLHLTDEAIDALARQRLQAAADALAKFFSDFATFPPPAQRALLSMAWAMGPSFPATWPRLSAFVRARRWDLAAEDCKISEVGEPGVVPRNKLDRELFLEAAKLEAQPSDPTAQDTPAVTYDLTDEPTPTPNTTGERT